MDELLNVNSKLLFHMQSLLDDNIKFAEKNNKKLSEAYKNKLGKKINNYELLVNDYYNTVKNIQNEKRYNYLIFAGTHYYPNGGWKDLFGSLKIYVNA